MASKRFTLIEPHFEGDIQIGPRGIGIEGDEEDGAEVSVEPSDPAAESADGGGGGGGTIVGLVVALVVLAVVALAAKKVLSGDSEQVDLDEFEE